MLRETPSSLSDLTTPALLVEQQDLDHNLAHMAAALPGARLRPHVKAHKCTALARRQASYGHLGFACATIREVEGMASAGLGQDLLLANEVVDARRLGRVNARVTVAVDSEPTIAAAACGGVREVLIDVDVGLHRCGCIPADAARLAELARSRGLVVRGVMGYEGQAMHVPDPNRRREETLRSMQCLREAHRKVGGEVISAGGTGTYDYNTWATEIQAGSYLLMDTQYSQLGLPFRQALSILSTVISTRRTHAVADCGLKALGMDQGSPTIPGARILCVNDEHIVFVPDKPIRPGDRIRILPAHVDPTVAYHERIYLTRGNVVAETWDVDLRGW